MSFDKPDDLHSRDTALARLLAEALKSQSKPAGHGRDSACPDAEVLAAYAEQGLAEEETARWESHFADCDRCQRIIAVLAASGEELAEAEVETLGSLAAASSTARTPVAQNAATRWTVIWRRPVFWRWLLPVAGIASAAALWLALRQMAPPESLSAQKIATRSEAPQNEIVPGTTARSAKPDDTRIAQADLPAAPASSPSSGVSLGDKEKAQANSSVATRQEALKKQETSRSAGQAPPISEADALETREEAAKDNRVPLAQAAEQQSQAGDAPTAAASAAPAAPSTPPPSRVSERAAMRDLDTAAGAPAPTRLKALAENAVQTIVFGSPNRRALWRLGSAGRIAHSSDEGQTWQPQASGVTADLLAGVAPSEKIAWVVGRGGIIVRTEDGEHWRQVTPPAIGAATPSALNSDWIGVEARDTLHATIISRDLRRFVTEDGGRTWVQEQ